MYLPSGYLTVRHGFSMALIEIDGLPSGLPIENGGSLLFL